MKEALADLWEFPADVRCITTNGTVTLGGENIMGGGCAYEAARHVRGLPAQYGDMIDRHGHHVFLMKKGLVMFPTKEDIGSPADIVTIRRSCKELMLLASIYDWKAISLPRPGCGLGGLRWEWVKPIIAPLLDDRVTVLGYPGEE